MLTPDELKLLIEKLAAGIATDEEIEILRKADGDSNQIILQIAQNITNVNHAQNSQFGDRIMYNADTQISKPTVLEENKLSVDEIVQNVRLRFHNDIQSLHGKIRPLEIDHCIDLGQLFVDVNILEKLSSSYRSEIDDLWHDFKTGAREYSTYRSLDRIGLGKKQQRVSGLTVLTRNTNLMVLGKPGSGKTTYLQHIVTECNQGRLQPHRIPVLLKLREFIDDSRTFKYSLDLYLTQYWRISQPETEIVLNQGRALILLDGLDEVTGIDGRELSKQIKRFARMYPQNQLIVTCRTQSQESRFDHFDYVEVADFNKTQVNAFAENWFQGICSDVEEGQARARQFLDNLYLEENKPIQELAITPILLSLICVVFQARGKFYSKRSKLYEEGLELLLEKWDKSREIERDQIYRDLSVERKRELLTFLAVKKFEKSQYLLFEQEEIEGYIAEFLGIEQCNSQIVLRSIESQHGLLIKRADKVWSFSHLTFQEYLVAKWFIKSADPISLENLANYTLQKKWQEVFLLSIEIAGDCLELLKLMQVQINNFLIPHQELQELLEWATEKSISCYELPYKPEAIRAFYLEGVGDSLCNNFIACSIDSHFELDFAFEDALSNGVDPVVDIILGLDQPRAYSLIRILEITHSSDSTLYESLSKHIIHLMNLKPHFNINTLYISNTDNYKISKKLNPLMSTQREILKILNLHKYMSYKYKEKFIYVCKLVAYITPIFNSIPDVYEPLREIVTNLLGLDVKHYINQHEQWLENHSSHRNRISSLMKHLNTNPIRRKFDTQHKKIFKQYYEANELLVNCLKISCLEPDYISKYFYNNLFLPISRIEKGNC